MTFNIDAFKKSIEFDLNKHYDKLSFLKEYLIVDKIESYETTASYLIIHKISALEKILEVYIPKDFDKKNNAYIGTIYKTEQYYYMIKDKL